MTNAGQKLLQISSSHPSVFLFSVGLKHSELGLLVEDLFKCIYYVQIQTLRAHEGVWELFPR